MEDGRFRVHPEPSIATFRVDLYENKIRTSSQWHSGYELHASRSLRRLQFDVVARINLGQRAVGKQCLPRRNAILPHFFSRPDNPDGAVPVEARIVFEGGTSADASSGMVFVNPAN